MFKVFCFSVSQIVVTNCSNPLLFLVLQFRRSCYIMTLLFLVLLDPGNMQLRNHDWEIHEPIQKAGMTSPKTCLDESASM